VHDARHSFAVQALRRSYRFGDGPQAALPRLARYLGHTNPAGTHYYLQFTEQLRRTASDRFRQHLTGSLFPTANRSVSQGGVK
jgi:integrase